MRPLRCFHNAHSNAVLAFPRTAEYGAAITKPWPPLWKRMLMAFWRWA